jgi:hypothetical protein
MIDSNQVISSARKWNYLNTLDNMIDGIPSLPALNDIFVEHYMSIIDTARSPRMTWEESLLDSQRGVWRDSPNRKPPAFFHPIGLIARDLRGNPSYSVQQYDEYDSQSTERSNNYYRVHQQKRPLTSRQLRNPSSYGEITARQMHNLTNKYY